MKLTIVQQGCICDNILEIDLELKQLDNLKALLMDGFDDFDEIRVLV